MLRHLNIPEGQVCNRLSVPLIAFRQQLFGFGIFPFRTDTLFLVESDMRFRA